LPTSRACVPALFQATYLTIVVDGYNPLVFNTVTVVPSHRRIEPLAPEIRAYCPLGFHATPKRSFVMPELRIVTVPLWYVNRAPAFPTSNAVVPEGFQLIPWIWCVFGLVTRVKVVPSYFRRSPSVPPMSAYDPSGFHATVFKSFPDDITPLVDICVSVVPSHLRRTAESPTISAYEPSGFQAINLRADVTGCPINVIVPF